MSNKRPKLQIPLSGLEIVIELVSGIILIANFVMIVLAWDKLPDTIPSHFNAAGEIDGYGSKSTLFILIPVTVILYAGITLLSRFPHIFNYAVEITEKNTGTQYRLARIFIRVLKAELVTIFTYLEYCIVMSALSGRIELGIFFLPVTLVVVFSSIGYYIYKSIKSR
jgi:Protein of unknown function (DUF1648).